MCVVGSGVSQRRGNWLHSCPALVRCQVRCRLIFLLLNQGSHHGTASGRAVSGGVSLSLSVAFFFSQSVLHLSPPTTSRLNEAVRYIQPTRPVEGFLGRTKDSQPQVQPSFSLSLWQPHRVSSQRVLTQRVFHLLTHVSLFCHFVRITIATAVIVYDSAILIVCTHFCDLTEQRNKEQGTRKHGQGKRNRWEMKVYIPYVIVIVIVIVMILMMLLT